MLKKLMSTSGEITRFRSQSSMLFLTIDLRYSLTYVMVKNASAKSFPT
jgi:hypothetical protein